MSASRTGVKSRDNSLDCSECKLFSSRDTRLVLEALKLACWISPPGLRPCVIRDVFLVVIVPGNLMSLGLALRFFMPDGVGILEVDSALVAITKLLKV
jgi:hypothetical protein